MKSILKTKILVILLVLISINFIYPCCCEKKTGNGGNNGNKSKKEPYLMWEKRSVKTSVDIKTVTPDKTKIINSVDKKAPMAKETIPSLKKNPLDTKKVEEGEKKKKEEEKKKREKIDLIIDGIKKYINNKDKTNRSYVKYPFNVYQDYWTEEIHLGWYNGVFRIKKYDNIDELLSLVQGNEFDKIKIKIEVKHAGVCNYIFADDVDFTIKDLFDSLKVLDKSLYPVLYDNDVNEYLCVKDMKSSKNKEKLFIDLKNGVLYFVNPGPIPDLCKVFGFTDEGVIEYRHGCYYNIISGLKCKIEEFIEPVLTKGKIENLKLALDK